MTQAQQVIFERALAKATIENLHIIGRGTVKATGQKFYAVTSSDGTGCYSVIVAGMALLCTCPAGRAGHRMCKHAALVRQAIINEHEAAKAQGPDDDAERVAALPVRRDGGPRLYRDEAPRQAVALEERVMEEW